VTVEDALGDLARTKLRQVRSGLEAILAMLSRDVSGPELQLVSPSAGVMTARDRATVKRAMAVHTAKPATKSGAAKKRRAS
jgi:hypothetical protein